jgi:hypothetical protein
MGKNERKKKKRDEHHVLLVVGRNTKAVKANTRMINNGFARNRFIHFNGRVF